MIEITLPDGTRYMLNAMMICCVALIDFGSIGDPKKRWCVIHWSGGGQMKLDGSMYDEVIHLWREKLARYYVPSSSEPELPVSDNET